MYMHADINYIYIYIIVFSIKKCKKNKLRNWKLITILLFEKLDEKTFKLIIKLRYINLYIQYYTILCQGPDQNLAQFYHLYISGFTEKRQSIE